MSELELSIRYKSIPARVALGALLLGLPVWGIIGPGFLAIMAIMVIKTLITGSYFYGSASDLQTLIGCLTLTFTGALGTLYFGDNRVLASKEGIAFPRFVLGTPRALFHRQRTWGEITSLQVAGNDKVPLRRKQLVFRFAAGRPLALNMNGLTDEDLEKLLLAADVWGNHIERGAELQALHESLQASNSGPQQLSYTAMWEEELGRRFSSTSFVPLEPGKKLCNGRIKIIRQLAFGGLSAIYLAQHGDKELVVIKEAVTPAMCEETLRAKAREMFQREAKFLMRLQHPNVAKVFDNFTEDGRDYLTIEYINGQDLRQLVRQNGAQSEDLVRSWAMIICDILEYLHNQDPPLIHRDLTPDNLVLSESEGVKLIDFGAANEFVGTATGTLVGKQAYISPEQFRGKACIQSDIYALGCTLYFLLTGKDPDALAVSRPRELQPDVSAGMNALVCACTALEPSKRPQSAAQVKEQLSRLLVGLESATAASPSAVAADSRSNAESAT